MFSDYDMDSFPPKRIMTESERAESDASFKTSATNLISPDLTARLQNVGLRVRRSEYGIQREKGYATDRFTSAQSSARTLTRTVSTPLASANETPLFRSSNDTLHAVFLQRPGPASTSREGKRPRPEPAINEEEDGELVDDVGGDDEHYDETKADTELEAEGPIASLRPMKPLRRTPRLFGQTQSLPVAVFGSSAPGVNPINGATAFQKFGNMEEEDWSASNFSGAFPAGPALKLS